MSGQIGGVTHSRPVQRASAGSLIISALAILGTALSLLLIVPTNPWMPFPGLDAAWCYAFNQAFSDHLVFGRDLIFTFGPLASVYTMMYGPATDGAMLWGSLIVGIGFCSMAAELAWPRHRWLLISLPLFVASSYFRDAIFMAVPLLVIATSSRPRTWTILAGSVAVGVLPLIKGSLTAISAAALIIACALLILQRRYRFAATVPVVAVLSTVSAWALCGQPIAALLSYLQSQGPIIAGYTEAMATEGPLWAVGAYVIAAIGLFALHFRFSVKSLLVSAGLFLFLATSLKAGFVRQDVHPRIAAAALLFAAFAITPLIATRRGVAAIVIAIAGWAVIENSTGSFGVSQAYERIEQAFTGRVNGLRSRLAGSDDLQTEFAAAKERIRTADPLPKVAGTSDVYPSELSILFANDLKWNPRPILQSYSAYLPELDHLNAAHLTGSNAPDNVFLSVEPLDGRLSTTEDAHSWPILLTQYRVKQDLGKRLWLVRSNGAAPIWGAESSASVVMNSDAQTPVPYQSAWASMIIGKTPVGHLLNAAYKLPPITLELKLDDGSLVYRRIVPEMAAGFILSPFIDSTKDFIATQAGHGRRVVSFRVLAPKSRGWDHAINVDFREMRLGDAVN